MDERADVLRHLETLLKGYTDDGHVPAARAVQGVLAAKIFAQVYSVTAQEYLNVVSTAGLEPAQWMDEENQLLSAWIERRSEPLPFGTNGLAYAPSPKPTPWQLKLSELPERWPHVAAIVAFVMLICAVIGIRFVLLMLAR